MSNIEDYKWKVCVKCITFNHAPYIVNAMNGFVMQLTEFPFVCIIVDDSSTDGEQAIIKQYIKENFDLEDLSVAKCEETPAYIMQFARHKKNLQCYFAVYCLKYNHYKKKQPKRIYFNDWDKNSTYIAMCEGDDYWTDASKLQIQVDFMESHPNHTMCIHAYKRELYIGNEVSSSDIYKYPHDVEVIPDKDVLNGTGMFGATASILYRSCAEKNYPKWALRAPVGDKPLKLVMFARGHIGYINRNMCVYKVGVGGSWTQRMKTDRKYRHETRRRMTQMSWDFDKWTEGKYHKLIAKGEREYKYSCFVADMKQPIKVIIRMIKRFFR